MTDQLSLVPGVIIATPKFNRPELSANSRFDGAA